MGYCFGRDLTLTVALAFVGRFIHDEAAYFERKPELVAAWTEREKVYRARKTDPSVEVANASWGEFFQWLRDNHDVS